MFPQTEPAETAEGPSPADTAPVRLSSYRKAKSASRYLVSGAPTNCAHCAQPFRTQHERIECWHGADNHYYCSEQCAAERQQKAA